MISYEKCIKYLKENDLYLREIHKHGDQYILITSVEGLHQWALETVKDRFDQGYFPKPEGPPAKPVIPLHRNIHDSDKSYYEEKLRVYKEDVRYYHLLRGDYEGVQTAINDKNGRMAYDILYGRRDAEYEGIEQMDFVHYS